MAALHGPRPQRSPLRTLPNCALIGCSGRDSADVAPVAEHKAVWFEFAIAGRSAGGSERTLRVFEVHPR